jgi:hypothetical protein
MAKHNFKKEHLPQFDGGIVPECIKRQREFLTPFYGFNNILTVGPTDGTETIAGSTGVFSQIDPDYFNLGLNAPTGIKTPVRRVVVCEQEKNATLFEIFSAVRSLPSRVLKQGQIVSYCRNYTGLINQKSTFFPFSRGKRLKEDLSNLYIASAFFVEGKLNTNVFAARNEWSIPAEEKRRFVLLH